MPDRYRIEDSRQLTTPALVVFLELVQENLDRMVAMAGDPARLRPHVKTHKTREVIELQLQRGIAKFKAATFAECEMLARAGARDVLLAYQVVGRNIERAVRFVQMFPEVRFMVIADHPEPVEVPVQGDGRGRTKAGSPVGPGYGPAPHRSAGRQPSPSGLCDRLPKARDCRRGDSTFTTVTCDTLRCRSGRPR